MNRSQASVPNRSALVCLSLALLGGGLRAEDLPPPGPPLPPAAVEQRNDKAIGRELRASLARDATTRGARIDVAVADGIVTLGGTAATTAIRDRAALLATRVAGVRQIRVEVALPAPEPAGVSAPSPVPAPKAAVKPPDRPAEPPTNAKKLEHQVKRALRWKSWTYAKDFKVRAHGWTVTVSAKVREPKAQEKLIHAIYALPELHGYDIRSDIRIVP